MNLPIKKRSRSPLTSALDRPVASKALLKVRTASSHSSLTKSASPLPTKPSTSRHSSPNGAGLTGASISVDRLAEETARMSLSPSYLYLDDEGYTRWQGETSCLPLLDLLVERHKVVTKQDPDVAMHHHAALTSEHPPATDWFPDRTARRQANNPEVVWKLVTSFIAPDLMDRCVPS